MPITTPAAGDPNWDVSLNVALNSLQTQITAVPSAAGLPLTIYVLPTGNDSNDGLSPSTAKLTVVGGLAALTGPGRVLLGPGTVATGGTVDLTDRDGVLIEGYSGGPASGTTATIVTFAGTGTSPAFLLLRSGSCTLKNFTLTYNNSGFTGNLIDISGDVGGDSPLCSVHTVSITSSGGIRTANAGIAIDQSDSKSIRNCYIHNTINGIYGKVLSTSHCNAIIVDGCHFGNNTTAHIRNPGDGWQITGCVFEPLQSGAAGAVVTDAGFAQGGIFITGCWLGDLTSAAGGTQFTVAGGGIVIVGNFIGISGSSGATGVKVLASSTGVIVNGNKFYGSSASEIGINVDATCVGFDVGNNTFFNVATPYSNATSCGPHIEIQSAKPGLMINSSSTTDGRATMKFQAARGSSKAYEMGIDIVGGSTKAWEIYDRTASATRFRILTGGSVVLGATGAALATTATDGFTYLPTCAGTPTGVPTTVTGALPMIYDSTNNKIYVYDAGWKATAALV